MIRPGPALGVMGRLLWSAPVRAGLGLGVIVAAFVWAIPSFASYGAIWNQTDGIQRDLALVLLVVAAANLLAPSAAQMAALPGLNLRGAVQVDWVTSAVTNTVPGGSAIAVGLTWTMYRRYQLDHGAIARSLVVTGVWDIFVKASLPLVAVIWLSTQQPIGPGLIQAAVGGAVLFVIVIGLAWALLVGPRPALTLGRLLDRVPVVGTGWATRLGEMRHDTIWLIRNRWRGLTWWTVAGHANLFALLVLCLRAVGVGSAQISVAATLAAFAFGRLVTAVPLTPGGLGVMEVSLSGALAAAGTIGTAPDPAAIVAAVLLFRLATFALPIPLGAVAWLIWNRRGAQPNRRRGADSPPNQKRGTDPTASIAVD